MSRYVQFWVDSGVVLLRDECGERQHQISMLPAKAVDALAEAFIMYGIHLSEAERLFNLAKADWIPVGDFLASEGWLRQDDRVLAAGQLYCLEWLDV